MKVNFQSLKTEESNAESIKYYYSVSLDVKETVVRLPKILPCILRIFGRASTRLGQMGIAFRLFSLEWMTGERQAEGKGEYPREKREIS